MATIRRKMGRFGVTVGFHVEFEKTAYWQRDVGRKLQFSARAKIIAETAQNWASPAGIRLRVFGQG
jgi:hypothetical protein